jgi:hypothetical protein
MIQATFIASGCFSHSSVEPSMSVKRKVTAPEGRLDVIAYPRIRGDMLSSIV